MKLGIIPTNKTKTVGNVKTSKPTTVRIIKALVDEALAELIAMGFFIPYLNYCQKCSIKEYLCQVKNHKNSGTYAADHTRDNRSNLLS